MQPFFRSAMNISDVFFVRIFLKNRLRFFAFGKKAQFFVWEFRMENKTYTKEYCIKLLSDMAAAVAAENRFPKRSDFSEEEVAYIKAFLGPWPRALEAAGVKAPREDNRKQKNLEKRIRAKRNRRENDS